MRTEILKLYPDREDVTLTTYLPADSAELTRGGKRPAVLVCPGGGYTFCSDREAEPVALRFAAMGYHAFVLRYSVYKSYPVQIRETGKAFLMIREQADNWLVDTDRIALCGFSAGAHNCALYANCWHTPVIYEFFNAQPEMFKPAAMILGYALTDIIYMMGRERFLDGDAQRVLAQAREVFMGKKDPDESLMAEVSPTRTVNEYTPPGFLWATAEDTLVPVQNTLLMAQALADKNIPFETHIFENGVHGLSLADQATAGSPGHLNRDAARWVELAQAWLEKRFALKMT
ncbi:MAG: alpha/beta hydrolase [Clostridiales bacterium]|jgi:acetyl esterase/lipase|nr:alpha/beta hydrolase [Clostridiales bacterium]